MYEVLFLVLLKTEQLGTEGSFEHNANTTIWPYRGSCVELEDLEGDSKNRRREVLESDSRVFLRLLLVTVVFSGAGETTEEEVGVQNVFLSRVGNNADNFPKAFIQPFQVTA